MVDLDSLISAKIFRNVNIKSTYLSIKDKCPKAYFPGPINFAILHT